MINTGTIIKSLKGNVEVNEISIVINQKKFQSINDI